MKLIDNSIISYIIGFLLRDTNLIKYISYGTILKKETKIVIIPDMDFWNNYGSINSIPKLPLITYENIPLLYGKNKEETKNGVLYIYADIIASSFYLLSRYEEMVNPNNRDIHGRYIGVTSLLGQANLLDRPLVDEYGLILLNKLQLLGVNIKKINRNIRNIFLTHDIDCLWTHDNLLIGIKRTIKNSFHKKRISISPFLNSIGIYYWNDYDSFNFIKLIDNKVLKKYQKKCKIIFFLIGNKKETIYTNSYIYDKKFIKFKKIFSNKNFCIGIHESYESGKNIELIKEEIADLQKVMDSTICIGRHHYLRSINLNELNLLEKLGIKVDFSMGYADIIGFRLGTARRTQWIDPIEKKLHNICLQPLLIMDGTLYGKEYMNLYYESALEKCISIIDKVKDVNGDFTFLIHNNINTGVCPWLKKLYEEVVDYLVNID